MEPYVPRILLERLSESPGDDVRTIEGTVVFVDISGFTRLSERLARRGKEGAERLTETINACFTALLHEAWELGGSLIKFGGDALLLWFAGEEHPRRACRAASAMRETLRAVSTEEGLKLRMSVGVHTGLYDTFLLGDSHREYVIAGPAVSRVVAVEAAARAGQILLSEPTAALLEPSARGRRTPDGVLLARAPEARLLAAPGPLPVLGDSVTGRCLSTALRAHLAAAPGDPEHRTATIAFLQFGGLDEIIARGGGAAAVAPLRGVVCAVQEAADLYGVCVLGSDVCADGGKLILTAGAPRVLGDDEERMLLALRQVLESGPDLPVRIGVNRGRVFAGEIGPTYRRTYTVMGDAVNLAARLMARAPWGTIYASPGVVDRSKTRFATDPIEPFLVKGKQQPVSAVAVGAAQHARQGARRRQRLPLVGRERELQRLLDGLGSARGGHGGLIEIVGDLGSGKSRLLTETLEHARDMRYAHVTCQPYTQGTAYASLGDLLRQVLGLAWDASAAEIAVRLEREAEAVDPSLRPWLPLVALVMGVVLPATREIEELGEEGKLDVLHGTTLSLLEHQLRVPTLVHLEHCQAMDEASAQLLGALAPELGRSAWLIVCARQDLPGGFLAPSGTAARLDLGPLPAASLQAIAEASPEAERLAPHVLETAVARADGSPEFLLDLLAIAAGGSNELPESVEAAASARIDALDPADRLVLRRASVLGMSFRPEQLAALLERSPSELDDDFWGRLNGVFTREADGYVRFKRLMLRDAAYHGLPFAVRRRLHARVAEMLDAAEPGMLSLHLLLAGRYEEAWRSARAAAERDGAAFAHADAARMYRRAIEAGRRAELTEPALAELWEALTTSLFRAGEMAEAARAAGVARRLAGDDALMHARLFHRLEVIAQTSGRLTAAVRWGRRGLDVLENVEVPEAGAMRVRLLAELAFIKIRRGQPRAAERLARAALEEAEVIGEERGLAQASYLLDRALVDQGRGEDAVHSRRALEIYERLGDVEEQGNVLNFMAIFAYYRWDWAEALDLYGRAAQCWGRSGNPGAIASAELNIGEVLSDRGIYDAASEHLVRARRMMSAVGMRTGVSHAGVLLGHLAVRRGTGEDGVDLLRRHAHELADSGEKDYADFALAALAEGEAMRGDPAAALSLTEPLLQSAPREASRCHRARGIALARLGSRGAAIRELERALETARRREALYDIAATLDVLRALGRGSRSGDAERERILARLQIVRLPELDLGASGDSLVELAS